METQKVKAVAEWPIPKTVKEVQAFLGFANFYRRFVPAYSSMARPLHDLTHKDRKWEWTEKEQSAFEAIKETMMKEPVLAHPDAEKPFYLETDVSGVAMGAILS